MQIDFSRQANPKPNSTFGSLISKFESPKILSLALKTVMTPIHICLLYFFFLGEQSYSKPLSFIFSLLLSLGTGVLCFPSIAFHQMQNLLRSSCQNLTHHKFAFIWQMVKENQLISSYPNLRLNFSISSEVNLFRRIVFQSTEYSHVGRHKLCELSS